MIKHLTQRLILLCAVSMMGVLQLGVTHSLHAQTTGGGCGPTDVELEIHAATCGRSNGFFTVTGVTGGTAPYMYSRNGSPFQAFHTFGNLVPGEYAITVRDAKGCTYTEAVTITCALLLLQVAEVAVAVKSVGRKSSIVTASV